MNAWRSFLRGVGSVLVLFPKPREPISFDLDELRDDMKRSTDEMMRKIAERQREMLKPRTNNPFRFTL